MKTITLTYARANLSQISDKIAEDQDLVIINRKENKNIVMISENEYNNLQENLHIREHPDTIIWIKNSLKSIQDDQCIKFQSIYCTSNFMLDYRFWEVKEASQMKRINLLISELTNHPFTGVGNPECLKYDLSGIWSRKIDNDNRLTYTMRNDNMILLSCRCHYS